MKRKISRIFGAAAVLICWVLFGGRQEAAANTKAEAVPVKSEQTMSGELTESVRENWYQTTVKSSGRLNLTFATEDAGLKVELYDQFGKIWESVNAPDMVDGKLNYFFELKKGTYYYCVSATGKLEKASYSIMPMFVSAHAKYESNTTRKKAKKISGDMEFTGHIAQNATKEYFKLTIKRMTQLGFSLHAKENICMKFYNKDGHVISSREGSIYNDFFGDWRHDWVDNWPDMSLFLYPGTYYLEISGEAPKDSLHMADAYGSYELQMSIRDESEGILKLKTDSAEYTGKVIAIPKATLKNEKGEIIDSKRYKLCINYLSGRRIFVKNIKKIGRYYIELDHQSISKKDDELQWLYAGHMFTVYPKQGKLQSVKSNGAEQITVRVKKDKASTGYQIQIASDEKCKKVVKNVSTKSVKKVISGLESGKKYYVRIRNYKTVGFTQGEAWDTEDICGRWSKVKTVICN